MNQFKLPDMSCNHCVKAVTQALTTADPACRVDIDLPGQTVTVQGTAAREQLAQALADAGYPPAREAGGPT
jgi:copper chaperone